MVLPTSAEFLQNNIPDNSRAISGNPNIGDNKTVIVPVTGAAVDVVFTFASTNTSANDTAITKYFDNVKGAIKKFNVRPSADVQIKAMNGIDLTDPIPVDSAGYHQETNTTPLVSLTLTVPTDGTTVHVRVM